MIADAVVAENATPPRTATVRRGARRGATPPRGRRQSRLVAQFTMADLVGIVWQVGSPP